MIKAPSTFFAILPGEEDDRRGNAGCLIQSDGAILAIRHRLNNKLGLPGGTALDAELAQCTAHRETWEETDLNVKVGEYLAQNDAGFLIYRCRLDVVVNGSDGSSRSGIEVSEWLWVDESAMQPQQWRFPAQLELIRELAAQP